MTKRQTDNLTSQATPWKTFPELLASLKPAQVSGLEIVDAVCEGHEGPAAAQLHISPPLQPMWVNVAAADTARQVRTARFAGTAARNQLPISM